jgi:hypothetical protein
MHRHMHKALLAALTFLAACDAAPTAPLQPHADVLPTDIVASVRGAAQFTNDQGVYRRMELIADRYADGTVAGTMQWVAGAAIIKGTISCLTVQGNTAWVGGVVESAKFTTVPAGSEFYMAVVDNGEGQGVRDQTTARPFLKPAGSAQQFCDAAAAPAQLFSMDHGNVHVR